MPLPSSGTLSYQDIQNEFGGSHPISINEYYRCGECSIPASGAIGINSFHGKSNLQSW